VVRRRRGHLAGDQEGGVVLGFWFGGPCTSRLL
jgi:hypothetical protein